MSVENAVGGTSWRPRESIFNRVPHVIKNFKNINLLPKDAFLFIEAVDLMTGLGFSNLPKRDIEMFSRIYRNIMYFNDVLDPLTYRLKKGRKSAIFSEQLYFLDQRNNEIIANQPIEKKHRLLRSMNEWFSVNRVLNIVSTNDLMKQEMDWSGYLSQIPRSDFEYDLVSKIKDLFEKHSDYNSVQRLILFRNLSSVFFSKVLIDVSGVNIKDSERLGIIKRVASMTMMTQTIDDYLGMGINIRRNVAGIGQPLVLESLVENHGKIDLETVKTLLDLTIEVVHQSLETMSIDKKYNFKEKIALYGLKAFSLVRFLSLAKVYDFEYYETNNLYRKLSSLFRLVSKIGYSKYDKGACSKATIDSLNDALSIVC